MAPYGHAPSWEKFSTLGKNPAEVPDGIMAKLEKLVKSDNVKQTAKEIISSGVDIPKIVRIVKNTSLYKIVPKGGRVPTGSKYWMPPQTLMNAIKSGKLEQHLGLPLERVAKGYEIYILLFGHYFPCIVFHFSYGSRHHFRFFLQQSHGHFLCFFILPRFVI